MSEILPFRSTRTAVLSAIATPNANLVGGHETKVRIINL